MTYSEINSISKDFSKLVMVAFVVAIPLRHLSYEPWLQGFAYRINVGITVVLLAGATTLLLALFTICYQSIQAALRNPVESLRAE